MLSAFRNAMRIGDLRRKILYTAALLLVFRLGSHIPVPGVDAAALYRGAPRRRGHGVRFS